MKNIASILFLVAVGTSFGEVELYRQDIIPSHYNSDTSSMEKVETFIWYSIENQLIGFSVNEKLEAISFYLNRDQADSLIESIEKYMTWNDKAIAEDVKLNKTIARIPVEQAFWKMGHEDWKKSKSVNVDVYFFSQNSNFHQFVIIFGRFEAGGIPQEVEAPGNNLQLSYKPQTIYFDYDDAVMLRNALKRESINEFLIKLKKEKAIAADFD